ncbi:MAG TPA: FecR family protein [Spirochaetia bacterium]|nr:FecR family protein [Spirochaetia bacterium]
MKASIIAAISAVAFLLIAPAVFSQTQIVLKEATGKVEVKAPGRNWAPVAVGAKLDMGASISTGFSSTALLDLGTSTLSVAPLTRMQIVDLVAKQGNVSTSLFLRVGKVHAEVKKVQGVRQDFVLKSPQATAAVRGTEFDFDGLTVNVVNGVVQFSNSIGQYRDVPAGEGSSTNGTQTPTSGDQYADGQVVVVPYTSPGGGGVLPTGQQQPATVTITWQ